MSGTARPHTRIQPHPPALDAAVQLAAATVFFKEGQDHDFDRNLGPHCFAYFPFGPRESTVLGKHIDH